jgi:chromosome segregation ATPase
MELALNQLQERFKAEQRVVRDLQATIDSLTARTEGDKQGRVQEKSALEKRTNQLQSRIQELEFECHQLKAAPRSKFTNGRTSTSTVTTDPQFVWMQQENGRLRDLVTKHESETEALERRIGQLQTEMTKVENEKVANERSLHGKAKELQEKVDDMSEELEYLRQQAGEASESREQQLMDRIDEDSAKIEQLQRQVAQTQRMQSTVVQTEEKLRAEMKKVDEAEAMNVDLVREKDAVLDELEAVRAENEAQQEQIRQLQLREQYGPHPYFQAKLTLASRELQQQVDEAQDGFAESTFQIPVAPGQSISRQVFEDNLMEEDADLTYLIRSTPLRPDNVRSNRRSSIGQQPVDYEVVERLLATIDRLRGERDDVKGHLEFSQVEHRFAVQAFEHRLLSLSSATESDKSLEVSNLEEEIQRLRKAANFALAKVEDSQMEAKRSQLAASAFSVVVDHVRENSEYLVAQYGASLRSNEELLSDANRRASIAESQLSEAVQRCDQAEQNRQFLSSRVEELEEVIQKLSQEASENGDVYRHLCDELEAAKTTVDRLRKVIQEVEAERDSLNLRIAHLEDDLSTTRTEQEELKGRYQTLQSQQLSSMSSTQASRALRQQIEELEGRVKRRTEQIGLHQHDIRRLETNLRLQEDRVAEMTGDIETLMNQKEAMVEDCAEAREARDHAIQRVEVLEDQVESFEERLLDAERERDVRDAEVATLVKVMAQAISDKRDTTLHLKNFLRFKSEQHREVQGQLHRTKEHTRSLEQQIRELGSVIASNTQDAMDVDEDPTTEITEELHQVTVALALSQTAYRGVVSSMSLSRGQHASAEARASLLQEELQALRDHRSAEEEASRVKLQSHIAELESTIRGLEQSLEETKALQEQTSGELAHAQEALRDHAERTEEQARHVAGLEAEIEKLSGAQSDQAQELQRQLEEAQLRLAEATSSRDEVDAEYEKLKMDVNATKEKLNLQLNEVQDLSTIRTSLEKELSEVRLVQAQEVARLQEELSAAITAAEKASAEQDTISNDHKTAIDELTRAKSELEGQLADTETRFATLQQQFEEKSQAWTQSEEKLQDELRFTIERSHKTEADLHRTIRTLEADLGESSSALETANEEKNTMEEEMTNLGAEIQRHRTLSQYLEKQVKEQ